ncbi:hypothetical protein EV652_104476 [Kribbella steppae]|uniref:Uncharacterized protein n=1 Tax=Kribbella steppae TaxID=2512223 RepID=A0A4V2S0J0_9ACTN|nr:hypothetical protein EV652_104476 [Kribbella steppae]
MAGRVAEALTGEVLLAALGECLETKPEGAKFTVAQTARL